MCLERGELALILLIFIMSFKKVGGKENWESPHLTRGVEVEFTEDNGLIWLRGGGGTKSDMVAIVTTLMVRFPPSSS